MHSVFNEYSCMAINSQYIPFDIRISLMSCLPSAACAIESKNQLSTREFIWAQLKDAFLTFRLIAFNFTFWWDRSHVLQCQFDCFSIFFFQRRNLLLFVNCRCPYFPAPKTKPLKHQLCLINDGLTPAKKKHESKVFTTIKNGHTFEHNCVISGGNSSCVHKTNMDTGYVPYFDVFQSGHTKY